MTKIMKSVFFVFLLILFQADHSWCQPGVKKYTEELYDLYTDYFQNDNLKSRTVARCAVSAIVDSSGTPWMELRWVSQTVYSGKDTVDQTADAKLVKPYRISLHSKGTLHLPDLEVASMTGAITDFNTFFVPLLPKSGYDQLHKEGDSYASSKPVIGNFANGKTILRGEDCIQFSSKLISVHSGRKVIKTVFSPPATACLQYYHPDFQKPVVADTANNIQMVIAAPNSPGIVQYGREFFDITATISAGESAIDDAFMRNDLRLIMKLQCDSKFENCSTSIPWHIYREVTLKRVK